eukprot:SAG31_NODE_102_length_25175_cov_10.778553_14_plen_78_part_00
MDSDREDQIHWSFPCQANDFEGVPESLKHLYRQQSTTLFRHLWTANNGTQILRKTLAEKFIGDFLDSQSSKYDAILI